MPPHFSLLHASYHRQGGPLAVQQAWLETADRPESVECIVALGDDDNVGIGQTIDQLRVVSPAAEGRVTAVRNSNAAARLASGDFLVVIADDLLPPRGRDSRLRSVTSGLDPEKTSFVVKVTEDPGPPDTKLRHPVVSRKFYREFGLFSEEFDRVHCDNDITMTAFWKAFVLDGRLIVTEHRHPTLDDLVGPSRSHEMMNDAAQYASARTTYLDAGPRDIAPHGYHCSECVPDLAGLTAICG